MAPGKKYKLPRAKKAMYTEFMLGKVLHHQRLIKKTTTASSSSYRTKAVSYAKRRVGDKYSQSRRNQKGYADCSSLMRDAYKSASGKYIKSNL